MATKTRAEKLWTILVLLLSATAAGCGGSRSSPGAAGYPAAPLAGSSSIEKSASGSDRSRGAQRSDVAPTPSERPGLGTEWGETRYSRVSETGFVRGDPSRPADMASIYYDDREGARAMARYEDYREIGDAVVGASWPGVSISLTDESGSPLPAFHAGGRTYAIGEVGRRYAIVIHNETGARLEAVASVDGLDVLDGRRASFEKRGYVVAPWGTVEIDGFRQSDDHVAAFRFGSVRDSYAARTGSDRNVGVIGVAFFQERGTPWPWMREEIRRRQTAEPFPGGRPYASPPPPRW